jgi:iron-sulfur cluster assembly accessory protein
LAQKRNLSLQDVYLRVYVDAGGCSGFSYKFEIDEAPVETAEDVVFSHPNIPDLRVVVDSTSLELIRGSTIDYVEEMIKSSFEVRNNPQSESACGCGSSFALKNFAANPAFD